MSYNVKEGGNMENTVNGTLYKNQIKNLKSYTVINVKNVKEVGNMEDTANNNKI